MLCAVAYAVKERALFWAGAVVAAPVVAAVPVVTPAVPVTVWELPKMSLKIETKI